MARMGETKVKNYSVDSVTVEIAVSTSTGVFSGDVDGNTLTAPSLSSLQDKIKKYIRANRRIAVPVTMVDDYGVNDTEILIRHITLTGIHGRSNNVMAKDDETERVEQLRYFYGQIVRRLTTDEIKELTKLAQAARDAYAKVEAWVEERQVSPTELVRAASEGANPALDQNTEKVEDAP